MVLVVAGHTPSLAGASDFTVACFAAVWKAVVVALVVAGAPSPCWSARR